jgi:hypothetical protein
VDFTELSRLAGLGASDQETASTVIKTLRDE